jgi:hypothetical protein
MTSTKQIIDKFNEAVDINKEYTKNELCIILNTVYKEVYSKNNKKEKRPPTKYNMFVSENMKKMKDEYPDLTRQDLMKKIGELWKTQKNVETEVLEKKNDDNVNTEENTDVNTEENTEEKIDNTEEKKPKKKVTKKTK